MKYTPTDNELIESFLLDKLSEKEIRAFKQRLENDREFKRKYNLIRTFPEMMSEEGKKEFKKKQAETLEKESDKKHNHFPKRKVFMWILFLFLIIAGIALFFIFHKGSHQNESTMENEVADQKVITPQTSPALVKAQQNDTVKKKEIPGLKQAGERGDTNLSKPVSLLTPPDGKQFSREEMLNFTWTMKTDSFTRFYIIAEGREKVILWRGIRPGIREYTIPGGYLYPGKFYWYVGTKELKRTFTVTK